MRTPLQPKNDNKANCNINSRDEVNKNFVTPLKLKDELDLNTLMKFKDEEMKIKTKNVVTGNKEFKLLETFKIENINESKEENEVYYYNLNKDCNHDNLNIFTTEINIEKVSINKEKIYSNNSTSHKSLNSNNKENSNSEFIDANNFFENQCFLYISETDLKLSGKINTFIKSNLEFYDN